MSDHTFTLRFLAPGWSAEDLSILLYERIDDASLMGPDKDGSFLLEFDRRSPSLAEALAAARNELLQALPDATVLRVEDERAALEELPKLVDIDALLSDSAWK